MYSYIQVMRIVIAGAGEVGFHLAKLLAIEKQDIVIIDLDNERLEHAENHLDVITLKGDATCPKVLYEANMERTELFIAVTSTEAHNITCCLLAKKMGALRTISRVRNANYLSEKNLTYFHELGIDSMVSPERLAAAEIKRLVKRAHFTDSFEFDNGILHLVGIQLERGSPLIGKMLIDTKHLNPNLDFLPVGIKRNQQTIIPRGGTYLEEGDFVYFISKKEGLEKIVPLTGKEKFNAKNVMIVGGSNMGITTAENLSKDYSVKLIEGDQQKCFEITDSIKDVLVIHGDARDVELLEEENIENMDIFIAVTGNSATNIMSCLVAKSHGVRKTIALVENIDYINLSQMIGIGTMINKKIIAASNIFRYIRSGEVLSLANIYGVDAEVLEFNAKPNTKILKGPIKELGFPKGAIIGGVIRNGLGFITLGDFQIEENDHVVVFCMHDVISKVEHFFN